MVDKETQALRMAGYFGFEFAHTGGGCTAFEMSNYPQEGFYMLVTEQGDPTHPESLETPVTVGIYGEDCDAAPREMIEALGAKGASETVADEYGYCTWNSLGQFFKDVFDWDGKVLGS